MSEPLSDLQLLRYSRHILLDEIGIEGQQRLQDASALVIGAGGLGSAAAMYLAFGLVRLLPVDAGTSARIDAWISGADKVADDAFDTRSQPR